MGKLIPSSLNCNIIYAMVSSAWEIRKEIFIYIRAMSKSTLPLAPMAKACMVLLSGAELGNFNLTNRYIVVENPILLCWAEMSKYSPHLIAAIDKYHSLGEDAPYCKLLYHSESLPEFNRQALRTYAAVARAIAIHEGQDSFLNYAGTSTAPSVGELAEKALFLVKSAGGINTKATHAIRQNLLADTKDNDPILHDLAYGAHVDRKEVDDDDSSGDEEENIGV